MTQDQKEPGCTLTDEELILRAEKWVHKLAQSGGHDWCLRVPVDFNNDPDMLFIELCNRLKAKQPESPADSIQDQDDDVLNELVMLIWNWDKVGDVLRDKLKEKYIIKRKP